MLYHIQNGNYGQDVNLGGLDAVYAASWPKAIHEGNGTMQLFITQKANEKQRKALVNYLARRREKALSNFLLGHLNLYLNQSLLILQLE